MNLDHLYYFKSLVETGSRNDTARIMSITPPTLSLAISKLEKELGVSLFEKKRLFGGFCGRDSGIGPAQRAKTTIWN